MMEGEGMWYIRGRMLLPKHSEGWFLLIFLVLAIPGFVLAFRFGAGVALNVVIFMEAVVVISGAAAFVIVEGAMLLAERYLNKRFNEGKAEGREEGVAEGKLEMWEAWMRDWERRRDEAAEQGLEFTEPPPPKPE